MGDHKVIKVGQLLHPAKGFKGSLKTSQKIVDRAEHEKLRGIIVGSTSSGHSAPTAHHCAEKIYDDRPDGNNQQDAGHDRYRLRPVRNRAVEIVMRSDKGIKERQAPES